MRVSNHGPYASIMDSSTDLALRRTFMAQERTLMAWIRTSVSMISFGFSIYKFFSYLAKAEEVPIRHGGFGPRQFAMSMISIGVLSLIAASIQHQRTIRVLEQDQSEKYESLARTFAVVVSILGLGLLGVVMLHL